MPNIAAGDNLAIPVVGSVFRYCGAFFIRRSFRSDAMYKALFKEYVTVMLEVHPSSRFARFSPSWRPLMAAPSALSSVSSDRLLRSLCFPRRDMLALQEGHNVEFYIEGGRSRTGKVGQPRLGMLGVALEGHFEGRIKDLIVAPISIQYDRVVEGNRCACRRRYFHQFILPSV